jgi:NACHT domain-containing protein
MSPHEARSALPCGFLMPAAPRSSRRIVLITILLALTTLLAAALFASASPPADVPTTRDGLIADIKSQAQRHAENATLQTSLAIELYRSNSVGLAPRDIARIYEEEFVRAKKRTAWTIFRPGTGWLLALALLGLLVLRDVLKQWAKIGLERIGEWVYGHVAGSRFFQPIALRHYRQALLHKHAKVRLAFRPGSLDMRHVFVPLRLRASPDADLLDMDKAMGTFPRAVIKGAPGAGKSMLLKDLLLTWAHGEFIARAPTRTVPVLFELHRLNDSSIALEEQLVAEFARNDFPNAARFVNRNLQQGSLILLLDGLDEVSSAARARAVQSIRDLGSAYPRCLIAITCRDAVYRDDLAAFVDGVLDLVEFDDQQILSFLYPWQAAMPADRSVQHLMQTLHDRPRIMALARNPLLLTIIAYLYTDTPNVLPHSRAEFYRQATDVLLRQWHQERNNFEARAKRLVLQHLALFNHDSIQHSQDRRSLPFQAVLTEVRGILPSLNLNPEKDTRPILDEIVERSGLLLAIDGGEAYQFGHLTLQEFFAASELSDDAAGLIERFERDHDAWREVVKLWCGLTSDSTEVIQSVYREDAITAFECLADAQKVDPVLANDIVDAFTGRLGEPGGEDIARAFAAVASDLRPRGAAVFAFLEGKLLSASTPALKSAAAAALSLTNLPRAATALAGLRHEAEARAALIRMGDLAVSALITLATAGTHTTIEDLHSIGTPQAAVAHSGPPTRSPSPLPGRLVLSSHDPTSRVPCALYHSARPRDLKATGNGFGVPSASRRDQPFQFLPAGSHSS